jgi:hypothetical protein
MEIDVFKEEMNERELVIWFYFSACGPNQIAT